MNFPRRKVEFPKPGLSFHTLFPAFLLLCYLPFPLSGTSENGGPLESVFLDFGLSRTGILEGRYYELLSHPFLHGNFLHWASNAFFIYYFAGRIRHLFGEKEVWRIAALATLIGGLFHLAFQSGDSQLVGASGIGMAFFVALTTVSPDSRMFPLPIRARNLRDGFLLGTLILLLINPALHLPFLRQLGLQLTEEGGRPLFQIGHACHLGGALAGWLLVRKYFRKPITLAQLRLERARREEDDQRVA